MSGRRIIIAYIPVIHEGYLQFLRRNGGPGVDLFVANEDLTSQFLMHQEKRALRAIDVVSALLALRYNDAFVLREDNILRLQGENVLITTPQDEVCSKLLAHYFPKHEVVLDTAFLRWDEKAVASVTPADPDRVSEEHFDREIMALARQEGERSSDWWRRIGAVLVKDGVVLGLDHNQHLPHEFTPYFNGDPRDVIQAGTRSELTSALHAEQAIITLAARQGIALEGSDLYVTTFPCPLCAKLVARSGIKRCYFETGHASLDGREVLKAANVELVLVQ